MMKSTLFVAALLVAATASLVAAQTSSDIGTEIFGNQFARCRVLKLDSEEFNPDPVTGEYPRLNQEPWKSELATIGVSIDATTKSGGPAFPIIFPTERPNGPTGGDVDLGTPNEACDLNPIGIQGIDARCFQDGPQPTPSAPFELNGGTNYFNCSTIPGGCPGEGCGGGRWKTTNPDDGDDCELETTSVEILLPDFSTETITCPVLNDNANCVPQGNVMVIQERASASVPNVFDFTNPDDDFRGGVFLVTFQNPVFLVSASILDMEERSGADGSGFITTWRRDTNGVLQQVGDKELLIIPGDNGFQTDTIRRSMVDQLRVQLTGSGSLNDIVWCEGEAEINVAGTWTRDCDWTIDKEVNQDEFDLLVGSSTDEQYTVTATRSCTDTFEVCGNGTVSSLPGQSFTIEEVRVLIDADPDAPNSDVDIQTMDCVCSGGTAGEQACMPSTSSPVTLSPLTDMGDCNGEFCTITCSFCADIVQENLPVIDSQRVIIDFISAPGSQSGDVDLRAIATFGSQPDVSIDTTAVVSDSEGSFADMTLAGPEDTYTIEFDASRPCDTLGQPPARFNCTSSLVESDTLTVRSDSTSVLLTCREPFVAKTAETYFERSWSWTVDKAGSSPDGTNSGETTTLVLDPLATASADVSYTFTPTATRADSAFAVSGTISVTNPHPTQDANSASLADEYAGTAATIVCEGVADVTDFTIPAASTVECNYSVSIDSATDGVNTATLDFAGFEFSDTANVQFDLDAPNVTFCGGAYVTDVFEGGAPAAVTNGEFDATTSSDETQTFPAATASRTFSALTCGDTDTGEVRETSSNTATIFCADTDMAQNSDSWNVEVVTPCERCPCEYEDYPNDPMFMGDMQVSVQGPASGICLCWQ